MPVPAPESGEADVAAVADDDGLVEHVAAALGPLADVEAVALGGSRALGTQRPESDFDFAVYYRGTLDTAAIRSIGWEGEVFEPGDWGGGVFNGGAWLTVSGRRVDLIYRDLDDVERRVAEANEGRFAIEQLPFYLAGIPTYVVVGELALGRVLVGDLPRPHFPDTLREAARLRWHDCAVMTLDFGRAAHAARGDVAAALATLGRAVLEASHSRLAARGEWVLNEKGLAERGGFAPLFTRLAHVGATPDELARAFDEVGDAIEDGRVAG